MNSHFLKKPSTWVGLVVLVALVAGGDYYWQQHKKAAQAKPAGAGAVRVTTAAVTAKDVPLYRTGIGTVTALQSVTVRTRVDGQLDQVGFTEGQDVKAGQVLARIDPRTLQAQLAQVQAQQGKDQATLANARTDLARYTQLIADDAATRQQLDTQKALVAQLEAAVKSDEAQIQFAQVQLGFTTIVAPISGRTGARLVDPGNIVHATDTAGLVVINQIDPITTVFTLPEEAVQAINRALQGSSVERTPLQVQAFTREGNQLLATGKLVLLNNQIDTTTGTVQLKASFPNPEHKLWPGQYVNARLTLGQQGQALTVPASAIQRGQDGPFVYMVDEAAPGGDKGDNAKADAPKSDTAKPEAPPPAQGASDAQAASGRGGPTKTVHAQPVTVAQIQDGVAVITKGVKAGDHVVTDGQYKLRPGATIREGGAQ